MKQNHPRNYWDTLDRKPKSQERFKDLKVNAHHAGQMLETFVANK